jgi:hypothetical protein
MAVGLFTKPSKLVTIFGRHTKFFAASFFFPALSQERLYTIFIDLHFPLFPSKFILSL